jgi:pimeloyl-ACP methyl ester carboxylesterase/DNA-binding CsgD family transcriptional regulator
MRQVLKFATAPDGVRLAYAVSGEGPPIVKAGHWLTHLERDAESPVWQHWLQFLSSENLLVRYDERGCGLSSRLYPSLTFEDWVSDLETVVEASGVDRFCLLGLSQGGPVAIAYAARHPERVRQLVLCGTYVRGRLRRAGDAGSAEEAEALVTLTRTGWGQRNLAFRRLFTNLFIPGGSAEQAAWFDDLQQVSCSAEHAARSRQVRYTVDVSELAASLKVPTLVLHGRDDAVVPFELGREVATLIPDARFVALDSANHVLLRTDPGWDQFRGELRALRPPYRRTPGPLPALTSSERHVLELVAQGRDNQSIAAALNLSVRTVERHLSNCYGKLGVRGKAARAAAAAQFASHEASL